MPYLQKQKTNDRCVFCLVQDSPDGVENLVVHRGKTAYIILNRYPYTSGHLMVVPMQHKSNLDELTPETRAEIMELISRCIRILRVTYRAQGFNVGANIGSAAGAGIPKHFHFHIVPRWDGDTNFMSAIGETRVVPEDMMETYRRVKEAWNQIPEP